MKIGLSKLTDILKIATKLAGPALGGPIGAALAGAFQLGQTASQLKSTLGKLQNSMQESPLKPSSQMAQTPQPFSVSKINVTIIQNPAQAATESPNQRFQMAPTVGNDSQWGGFSQAANSRISGNGNGLFDGSNPWAKNDGRTEERAAVGWVMQQNDSLRYDADRKTFFTTAADGKRTDKLSLDQVVNTIRANGGASPNAGAAFQAVGKLANDAAHAAKPATPQQSPFNAIMDMFKQVMNLFQQMMGGLSGQAGQSAGGLASGLAGAAGSLSGGSGSAAGGFPGIGPVSSFLGPLASGAGSAAGASASNGGGASPSAAGWGDGGASGGATSGASAGSGPGGGNLDSMMSQAESLMKSGKMEDQLKGQKMMQQAMRTFELLSKMIEKQSEMASKAIAAIK